MTNAFHITDRLGAGGHGAVYLASMLGEHGVTREVAVKVLRSSTGSGDPGEQAELRAMLAARLRDEARIMGQLDHPAIAKVITMTYLQGEPSVVLEYVRGRPLRGVHMPPRAALELVGQVAGGLRYAHARGVLHRDIKPDNIVLTEEGAAKILDFGIARVDDDARESKTQTGMMLGTARYMAPELIRGELGPAVDIYALGVVMHELLTGQRWRGVIGMEPQAAMDRICGQLAQVEDETIQALVWGMVNPDPTSRYTAQTIEDWCHDHAARFDGASLRRFARQAVAPRRPGTVDPTDPFLGRTLSGSSTLPSAPTCPVIPRREGYPEDHLGLEGELHRAAWELGLSGTYVPMHRGETCGNLIAYVPGQQLYLELLVIDTSPMGSAPWLDPRGSRRSRSTVLKAGPLIGDGQPSLDLQWFGQDQNLVSALREAVEHWARPGSRPTVDAGYSRVRDNYALLRDHRGHPFGPKEQT